MRRALGSFAVKCAVFIGGYASAFILVCSSSERFGRHIRVALNWNFNRFFIPALIGSLICVGLFFISVWISGNRKSVLFFEKLHELDFGLLTVLTLCAFCFCFYFIWKNPYNSAMMLLLPLAACSAWAAFIATILTRLKRKTFKSTLHWLAFFKVFRLNKAVGLFMLALLSISVFLLCSIGLQVIMTMIRNPSYGIAAQARIDSIQTPLFLLSIFDLIALTYLSRFMLSMSALYEKANEDKVRSERFKAELITNVSHDIRTPLTSIINHVDLLKRLESPDERLAEHIVVMDQKSQRLKTLLADLIEASKAGTGNIPVQMTNVDLAEIIGQAAGEFDQALTDSQITFVFTPPEEKIIAFADSRYLWRVMENLFCNVAKYAMPGTRLHTEVQQDGNAARFTLRNVSRAALDVCAEDLIQQFIQGDRSRGSEGNGLGLYIAKNLMECMNGELAVRVIGDLFEVSGQLKISLLLSRTTSGSTLCRIHAEQDRS